MILRSIIAVTMALTAVPAAAAAPLEVTSRALVEQRVRAPDGTVSVTLVKVGKVVPGDRVQFVLAFRNTGKQPIADLVLANPVPKGIAYRGPGAGTPTPEVSVDGKTFAPLARLAVRGGDGRPRPAGNDDVTVVRWRLSAPLAAGAQGQFAFQGVLK